MLSEESIPEPTSQEIDELIEIENEIPPWEVHALEEAANEACPLESNSNNKACDSITITRNPQSDIYIDSDEMIDSWDEDFDYDQDRYGRYYCKKTRKLW